MTWWSWFLAGLVIGALVGVWAAALCAAAAHGDEDARR